MASKNDQALGSHQDQHEQYKDQRKLGNAARQNEVATIPRKQPGDHAAADGDRGEDADDPQQQHAYTSFGYSPAMVPGASSVR